MNILKILALTVIVSTPSMSNDSGDFMANKNLENEKFQMELVTEQNIDAKKYLLPEM